MENNIDRQPSFEIVRRGTKRYNLKYKVILVGDSIVGKSCICLKHTNNSFVNNYNQTDGYINFDSKIRYKDVFIKLQLYDTSGNDMYNSLISILYRNTSLALIVYSIDE